MEKERYLAGNYRIMLLGIALMLFSIATSNRMFIYILESSILCFVIIRVFPYLGFATTILGFILPRRVY
ncbi:MAG: hypothetical protein FWF79_07475 [Defluviitaleaceae bacterium]|nr:hypothetical protein [Defluviitaleaceae bacterium]